MSPSTYEILLTTIMYDIFTFIHIVFFHHAFLINGSQIVFISILRLLNRLSDISVV